MALLKSKKRKPKKIGKQAWDIVTPNGTVMRELGQGESAAITLAQRLAELAEGDGPVEFTVRYVGLFGEPDPLYAVVRDECGVVWTTPVR
jgi:hypothetical protein